LEVLHKEIKACHSKKHQKGVWTSFLGKADVVGHEREGDGTGNGNVRGKGSGKNIDYRNGEGSKEDGNNTEVSFGFGEGIKLVG